MKLLCYFVNNCIYSTIIILTFLLLFRQLDVFDVAGSGDGANGNSRTSSQQMLVIFCFQYPFEIIYPSRLSNTFIDPLKHFLRLPDLIVAALWEKDGECPNTTVKFAQQEER